MNHTLINEILLWRPFRRTFKVIARCNIIPTKRIFDQQFGHTTDAKSPIATIRSFLRSKHVETKRLGVKKHARRGLDARDLLLQLKAWLKQIQARVSSRLEYLSFHDTVIIVTTLFRRE